MKTVSLVLALAALRVPAAAGAAQTHAQHSSPVKVAKAHAGKVKIYGTVTALSRTSVTVASASKSLTFQRGTASLAGIRVGAGVEAEGSARNGALRLSAIHLDDRGLRTSAAATAGDDRGGRITTVTAPSDDPAGDDRGGQTTTTTTPSDDPAGDDRGGQTTTPTTPSDDPAGDDRGGHGQDDGPGHH